MKTFAVWLLIGGFAMSADILAFTRPGCSPCERFKSDYGKNAAMLHPHTLHVTDSRSALGRSYGIKTVPTFIKLSDGKEVARKVGYSDAASLKAWADQ